MAGVRAHSIHRISGKTFLRCHSDLVRLARERKIEGIKISRLRAPHSLYGIKKCSLTRKAASACLANH